MDVWTCAGGLQERLKVYPWWLQVGAQVLECAVVIELKDLNGKAKLNGLPLYVQVQKEGACPPLIHATVSCAQNPDCWCRCRLSTAVAVLLPLMSLLVGCR